MTDLKILSDEELLNQTQKIVGQERQLTAQVLLHLREVERRRLFAARGFSSLFEYCVKALSYSGSGAYRRIEAMRALNEMPELKEKIESGSLSLNVITQAQTFFKQERITNTEQKERLFEMLEGKSTRAAEKIIANQSSPETIKQVALRREQIRPVAPNLTEVKFLASDDLIGDLEKLKGLLAHRKSGQPMSLAEIISELVKIGLQKLDPAQKFQLRKLSGSNTSNDSQRNAAPTPEVTSKNQHTPRPYLPSSLKTQIWKRDNGQCTFKDPVTGKKCESNFALEIDHIHPVALGGDSSLENLRLLCSTHNPHQAIQAFGKKFMEKYLKP